MNKQLTKIFVFLLIAVLASAVIYTTWIRKTGDSKKGTIVFMDNFRVFESFAMKKDYDKRLEKEIYQESTRLDSLAAELSRVSAGKSKASGDQEFKNQQYYAARKAFDEKFNALSKEYTSQVYARLNMYIKDFGKAGNYRIILGASGDGNVMYVEPEAEITDELIQYINKQYLDK